MVGRPELVDDPRFADNAARMAHRPELVAELEAALSSDDTDAWVEALLEAGVPAGPIHDYAQAVADPHTLAREMVVEMEHPEAGTVYGLGIPVKLSATPGNDPAARAAARRAHRGDPGRAARWLTSPTSAAGVAAWVTFDRPEAHNAMTFAMYDRLVEHCEAVDADDDVRVMVLRGAGDRAFVAGTDIRQFAEFTSAQDGLVYETRIDEVLDRLEAVRKPTIALVDGFAMGSGLAISAACDLRVITARREVRHADRAHRRQLPLDGQLRPPGRRARRPAGQGGHLHSPAAVGAEEALAIGFVTAVVDDARRLRRGSRARRSPSTPRRRCV